MLHIATDAIYYLYGPEQDFYKRPIAPYTTLFWSLMLAYTFVGLRFKRYLMKLSDYGWRIAFESVWIAFCMLLKSLCFRDFVAGQWAPRALWASHLWRSRCQTPRDRGPYHCTEFPYTLPRRGPRFDFWKSGHTWMMSFITSDVLTRFLFHTMYHSYFKQGMLRRCK